MNIFSIEDINNMKNIVYLLLICEILWISEKIFFYKIVLIRDNIISYFIVIIKVCFLKLVGNKVIIVGVRIVGIIVLIFVVFFVVFLFRR